MLASTWLTSSSERELYLKSRELFNSRMLDSELLRTLSPDSEEVPRKFRLRLEPNLRRRTMISEPRTSELDSTSPRISLLSRDGISLTSSRDFSIPSWNSPVTLPEKLMRLSSQLFSRDEASSERKLKFSSKTSLFREY